MKVTAKEQAIVDDLRDALKDSRTLAESSAEQGNYEAALKFHWKSCGLQHAIYIVTSNLSR